MNEIEKLAFYEQLTSLLKANVMPKSEDIINGEESCDSLKKVISAHFDATHKLDVFSDEFNFTEFVHEHIDYPIERMKEQIEKTWLRDKLTIGLMGHFSTGKTTALNLLFGESFQTNSHENTALATYLTYGNNSNMVTLVDKAGQSQELTMQQCKLLDYSSGISDFPFARIFNYMVKENNNEMLKDLTIIDTPGLFSTSSGHSDPTYNVISSCDAIFWFINITDSATKEDIKKIKDYVSNLPLFIIFSYVDAISPSASEKAISSALKEMDNNNIEYKGYLKLGKREQSRQQFKLDADKLLKQLVSEHDIYIPIVHVIGTINFLESILIECKKNFAERVTNLDSETDQLLADYRASSRTFVTEYNNSQTRFNNMINTFNERCSGATFCGGASGALCNNIISTGESLSKMVDAYNNMNESKLVDFGRGCAQMNLYQYKLDQITEILSSLTSLKKQLID